MSRDINYIFSEQGIEELKSRLGLQPEVEYDESLVDDLEFEQTDGFAVDDIMVVDTPQIVESGGVSFPFPITISDPVSRIAPDGSTVFDIVVSFDDVQGATD